MEETVKIIFNEKEVEDLRKERVSLELEDPEERTDVDLIDIPKLLMVNSMSGTMHIRKNTENYNRMIEFFEYYKEIASHK